MATVGDIIMEVRTLGPDLPLGVLGAPAVVAAATTGGTLAAQTYYWKATWTNPWGETVASAEGSTVVSGSNNAIQFTFPAYPATAQSGKVYIGTAAGAENQWFSTASLGATLTVTSLNGVAGVPPVVNTAYLPDSDGGYVSAASLYRWLNEALALAGRAARGIKDESGIQSTNGTGLYQMPSYWSRIERVWFDGLPVRFASPDGFFYRNSVPGIPGAAELPTAADVMTIRLYPQPNRSGGSTTLTSLMGATDTTASVGSTSGFLLPFGFAVIDSEVVAYSGMGAASLTGLIRGVGGTVAAAHANGATVAEGNIRIQGRRMPAAYLLGAQLSPVRVPPGWESKLATYMLAKFRLSERDSQEHARLAKDFYDWLSGPLNSEQMTGGPRQMGGNYGIETIGGSFGGGLIIP